MPRLIALIFISAVFTLLRSGPLNGTMVALALTVLFQVYLPGYLLARFAGKLRRAHPVLRFAWMLVCGLSLTIVLGGILRLFNIPVTVYLLLLHLLMLALAWFGKDAAPAEAWRLSRKNAPLYMLLLLACVAVMGVSSASRYRFHGFEDQVVFTAAAEWLAENPGELLMERPVRTRQVGRIPTERDTRPDTDGWTYNHAAWVWVSGIPTAELIWYDLDPLFVWTVPLVMFALAYTLTKRETAAAWTVAALLLVGLLTLDNIAYAPSYTAYGRFALFQINTLRQFSIAIMLPLTLMIGLAYLQERDWRDLALMLLAGAALAMLHPVQIMLFIISMLVTAGLKWLTQPTLPHLRQMIPLLLGIALLFSLPFIQRLNRAGTGAADSIVNEAELEEEEAEGLEFQGEFTPVLGTFIRNPAKVFYHPLIAAAALLGLLYVLRVRQDLAAQYIFGTSLVLLLLFFAPGLVAVYNRVVSSVGVLLTIFLLPVALIFGLGLDLLLRQRESFRLNTLISAILVGLGVLILFEPLPVPASAQDRLYAYTVLQENRRLEPAHWDLIAALPDLLPADQMSVVMAPGDSVNLLIEELPDTLITGGRSSGNKARHGDHRFYNLFGYQAPWLDSADLDFMEQYGVTHLISLASHTRLAQLRLQPERFPVLATIDGQVIFAVDRSVPVDAVDALFGEMNAQYAEMIEPRWQSGEFILLLPGDAAGWAELVAQWEALQSPDDDRARLGLAFSYLMMGADEQALPLWRELHERYPELPLLVDALAYTYQILDQPEAGFEVLWAALHSERPEVQALAARSLLSETFFYLLSPEQLDEMLAIIDSIKATWDYLVIFDEPEQVREQAALLMFAQRWDAALEWLDQLPQMMLSPRDITAQAAALLMQGELEAALERLKLASDPDWYAPRAFWHPDRWEVNEAADMYQLLLGDIAIQEGRWTDAINAYQLAAEHGSVPAQYFLSQAYEQAGQPERAREIRDALDIEELVPLLSLLNAPALYVQQPELSLGDDTFTLTATFSDFQPHQGYPLEFWRVEVVNAESGEQYLTQDFPAQHLTNALVRVPLTVVLPEAEEALTPALIVLKPGHSNAVTAPSVLTPLVLNRPDVAEVPAEAEVSDWTFGDSLHLRNYTVEVEADQLTLRLYWEASAALPSDYQIFVHVLDATGEILTQADSGPVQNRYPMRQWRLNTLIEDPLVLRYDHLPEHFSVRIGVYQLPDVTRLPVTPDDARVEADSVLLWER